MEQSIWYKQPGRYMDILDYSFGGFNMEWFVLWVLLPHHGGRRSVYFMVAKNSVSVWVPNVSVTEHTFNDVISYHQVPTLKESSIVKYHYSLDINALYSNVYLNLMLTYRNHVFWSQIFTLWSSVMGYNSNKMVNTLSVNNQMINIIITFCINK